MAISGDLRVYATVPLYHSRSQPRFSSFPSPKVKFVKNHGVDLLGLTCFCEPGFKASTHNELLAIVCTACRNKNKFLVALSYKYWVYNDRDTRLRWSMVDFSGYSNGASSISEFTPKCPSLTIVRRSNMRGFCKPVSGVLEGPKFSSKSVSQEAENFLLDAVNMSFFERLNLAWKIVFPSAVSRKSSNARIAKQRLKMILFSDRCEVSDEAKRKIVNNIVRALSDFVEIESQDKVQLSVSSDTDIGTIYSVTVPVRRVKPEYQDMDEVGTITNIEFKETGDSSGSSVDVRFDFFVPDERS